MLDAQFLLQDSTAYWTELFKSNMDGVSVFDVVVTNDQKVLKKRLKIEYSQKAYMSKLAPRLRTRFVRPLDKSIFEAALEIEMFHVSSKEGHQMRVRLGSHGPFSELPQRASRLSKAAEKNSGGSRASPSDRVSSERISASWNTFTMNG